MEFLYIFALMFLSIFGLAVLMRLFWLALSDGAERQYDVYVKTDENVEEFVDFARKSSHISTVNLILVGNETDESARALAEKYADVRIVGKTGR